MRHPERPLVFDSEPEQFGVKTMWASTGGSYFLISPAYKDDIADLIKQVRDRIKKARRDGRDVIYLSVPISEAGGGHFPTNLEIAATTARRLEKELGGNVLIVNSAAYSLPQKVPVAGGGDYMAVWSDVLAGHDGGGEDIDMVYFAGPHDVASFFRLPVQDKSKTLNKWIDDKAADDPSFKKFIEAPNARVDFLRYYLLRGSATYSRGGHDEWNLIASLNSKRQVGEQIAIFFDGRAVEPSAYSASVRGGYQIP